MEIKLSKEDQDLIVNTKESCQQYQNFKVVNNQENNIAINLCKEIKLRYNALEVRRKKLKEPIIEAGKGIDELFREPLSRLLESEKIIKNASLKFENEQEQKRLEEERKLKELQEKEAEKLLKKAEKQELKGNTEKAEELKLEAEIKKTITPIVAPTIEKVSGANYITKWKFKITDQNKVPREYMIPNEEMLSRMATATKGTLKIDGIEFYSEKTLSVRTK